VYQRLPAQGNREAPGSGRTSRKDPGRRDL